MNTAKNVTVIPATLDYYSAMPTAQTRRKRVAAYARVSTDKAEQITSYDMQVRYYTNYIYSNPSWDFVKIYTDEGITAVNTKHRAGFKEMISDALSGKIDLIEVSEDRSLDFIVSDKTKIHKTWHYTSRSESWTEEKRQAARERALRKESKVEYSEKCNSHTCNA